MTSQTYILVMMSEPALGQSYELVKDEIRIGRGESNDIIINELEVSRKHACLTKQAAGYVIEDLGSTNGTFVNGTRLIGPHLLRPGETITLGEKVNLELKIAYDTDATVPTTLSVPPEESGLPVTEVPAQAPPAGQVPLARPYTPTQLSQSSVAPTVGAQPVPVTQTPIESRPPAQPVYDEHSTGVSSADEAMPDEDRIAINWNWVFAGCGCVTIFACIAVVAALFWIDAGGEARWCQYLGFLFPTCP